MADWLSNQWIVGSVTSVVGGLLVLFISSYWLGLRERRRESDVQANPSQSIGKSKVYLKAAVFGLLAALPAYYLGIWLRDAIVDGVVLEQLEAGTVLRDCEVCPIIIVVPSGTYSMGSPFGEAGRYNNEGPIHPVTIQETIGVGVYEVTRGQFREFIQESGYEAGGACWTFEERRWREREGRNWRYPGYPQTDQHPVVCVNWYDANRYVEWLSLKTGQRYRLPTESEWEYAARAGTTTTYYWGDAIEGDWRQCQYANGADLRTGVLWRAGCDDGHEFTAAVGSYLPNPFGLHDTLGNVWEWTQDCWSSSYTDSPADGSAYRVGQCELGVLRGGSRYVSAEGIRAAHRFRFDLISRNQNTGFRVVRWAKSVQQTSTRVGIETLEPQVSEERNDVAGDASISPTTTIGIEFNCDTLTAEIADIPSTSVRDANLHEIISILLKELPEADREDQLRRLQCAGQLARLPSFIPNKDAELSRVIEANLGVNSCSAARELTEHLQYTSNRSAQIAKVAVQCLGRD